MQFLHERRGNRNQQTRQGCYLASPYIWHKGDDRGCAGDLGESILVNPLGINQIKRIIVYTFIYEGVAQWSDTNAVVRVKIPNNEEVVVEMGAQSSKKRSCAIAAIDFGGDDSITVKKLISFHNGHSDCDKEHHWGLNYASGTKD